MSILDRMWVAHTSTSRVSRSRFRTPIRVDRRNQQYFIRLVAALLGAALALSLVDLALFGLSSPDGPTPVEWLLRAALWFGPFGLLLLRSDGVIRAMGMRPTRWRTWMLLWAIVAAPFAQRPGFTIFDAAVFLSTVGLGSWFVTRVGWRAFLDVVAVTAGALAAASIVAGLAGLPEAVTDAAVGTNRLGGISTHPNQLAQVAGVAVLLAWSYWRGGRRRIGAALVVTGGGALLWTQSRTGIAALALSAAWILFMQSSRLTRVRAFIVALLVVIGISLIGVETFTATLVRTGSASELTTLTGRTEVWSATAAAAAEDPLTGLGFGSSAITDAVAVGDIEWQAGSAHSDWLNALLVFGVPGTMLWLAMWISYARHSVRRPDVIRDALMIFCFTLGLTEVATGPVFPTFIHYVLVGCLAAASTGVGQPTRVRDTSMRTGSRRRPPAAPYSSNA